MAIFVLVTDSCMADARTYNLTDDVERLKERIERVQSANQFDPFPPPYLVKKKFGGRQGRLIADQRTVGEHAVIVFLAILIRGNRAYEDEFAKNPVAYGESHFADLVSDEGVAAFVEERTRTSPPPPKPEPSAEEYALLFSAFEHHQDSSADDLVCETREWVDQVNTDRVKKQLILLCGTCMEALGREAGLHYLPVDKKPDWGVWALRSEGRLLLITLATESNAAEAEAMARKVAAELEGRGAEDVLRASRRAYPAVILAVDELWIDLEGEREGNMALSPEESQVLESARGSKNPFPLFINGRAGSGKSTILQYLFADLLFYYLSNKDSHAQTIQPPIYLTANGELLRVARSFVERLLRSEAIFTQRSAAGGQEEDRRILESAFKEFRSHLLTLVPAEDRLGRFAPSRRVDYARFRRMWMERFGKEARAMKEFGPDLSWHVIRSYIKGMSSETYLEPEDYQQLPENQISVTHEAFNLVFLRVWSNWYQRALEAEGLWDDQDLTRYVLDHDLVKAQYPAVFCDEAQDFTRLELEMLLRHSLYSSRNLAPRDISRVPFAFAGDPFQTLNPTGFRWDAIKASFVEKFIFELDPVRRSGGADLNYRELKYNYRSTHRIVKFSNHVQAMRAAIFKIPDLRPSQPWTADPACAPVMWFRSNDEAFWKRFQEESGFIVIVPCNEGEEQDYVQADPILMERIKTEDGVPSNVLSASRAKGCEYPAVVVYGFGSAFSGDLETLMSAGSSSLATDPDRSLPFQYFINRLYVAVSRPKRRLVIVDTEQGFARLWKLAQDQIQEQRMLSHIKNGQEVWAGEIEGMTIGKPEDLTREDAVNPLENAKVFEADGLARNDAFLLLQAAQAYRAGGDLPRSRECRARAFEAEAMHLEAGNAYVDAGFVSPDAVRCLWRAGRAGWARLCELVASFPQIRNDLEVQWAISLNGKPATGIATERIESLARLLEEDPAFAGRCVGDPLWNEALVALLGTFRELGAVPGGHNAAERVAVALDRIASQGMSIPAKSRAPISFIARRFAEAIACWEATGDTRTEDYLHAKAGTEPYPDRLTWLNKLGRHDQIIDDYQATPDTPLGSELAGIVVDAFVSKGRYEDALAPAWNSASAAFMLEIALGAFRSRNEPVAGTALRAGIQLLTRQDKGWDTLTAFIASNELVFGAGWKEAPIRAWIKRELAGLQICLVKALARSEELVSLPTEKQKKIAEFLRDFLRVKEGHWMSHLSIQEAGAAHERAGRFTDAISFYEALLKDRGLKERRFAIGRWLVAKNRQLEFEKSKGSPERARVVEQEIRKVQEEWRIASIEALPTFPELEPLPRPSVNPPTAVTTTPPPAAPVPAASGYAQQPTEARVGVYRVEVSRKAGRCNITHTGTLETVTVRYLDKKVEGEALFESTKEDRMRCKAWGIALRFPSGQNPGLLVLGFEESGIQLVIHV